MAGRQPTEREKRDVQLGIETLTHLGALDVGQTVVVKEGVILALEAVEGTDEAVLRGAFGAPTFFVGDEMFFGNDHVPFLERALAAVG